MNSNIAAIIADSIESDLQALTPADDETLFSHVSAWLDAVDPDRFASTRRDRFMFWLDDSLLPALRRLGQSGQQVWDTICDPTSTLSKERIASAVLALAVMTGLQHLDLSTLVAIVVLAIRSKAH